MSLFRYLSEYLDNFFRTQKTAILLTGARQTGRGCADSAEKKSEGRKGQKIDH